MNLLIPVFFVLGLAANASAQIPGWWNQDIGTSTGGSASMTAGVFTVTGDGADIWGGTDAFYYVYKKLSGDGEIIARVVSIGGPSTSGWRKAGVMIRNTLDATSFHAFMAVTPTPSHGLAFQYRDVVGDSDSEHGIDNATAPYWVKLVRQGNQFTAYHSPDGITWTIKSAAGDEADGMNPVTILMNTDVYIGLAVTSVTSNVLCTCEFDNVALSGNITDKPPQLKAWGPSPANAATGVVTGLLQWSAGETAAFHDVYFGTNATPGPAEYKGRQTWLMYWIGSLAPGTTYYWRIDEVEANRTTIHTGDVWRFSSTPLTAWDPTPADGATNVMPAVDLKWRAGMGATKHRLYFGDSLTDVDSGTGGTDKGELAVAETTYHTGPLYPETTYYWRVDEYDGTTWRKGNIWSFATSAAGTGITREWWTGITGTAINALTSDPRYPDSPTGREVRDMFEGPVNWADNYGSRLYGWLMPPESADYTFWIASDDQSQLWLSTDADPANKQLIASISGWVASRDFDGTTGVPGANQKSAAKSLVAGQKYYIEALMKEGSGGDNIAVAWQGGPITARQIIFGDYVGLAPFAPLRAYGPTPANLATNVTYTPTLSWRPGQTAVFHDVYFGTNPTLGPAEFKTRQICTIYSPGALILGATYYWRIDEIEADGTTIHEGDIWNFTVADYIVVDDFESYTDYSPNRIFQTWKDGWGYSQPPPGYPGNGTGSTVGNSAPPYAERTFVHGGMQSMPLSYDNSGTGGKACYSETFRELTTPQDWTIGTVQWLTLCFHGAPANAAEPLYVALEDNAGHIKVVTHFLPDAVREAAWQQWGIGLKGLSAAGVNVAAVKKIYIGLGNRTSPTPGGTGKIYIDDIGVCPTPPSLARDSDDVLSSIEDAAPNAGDGNSDGILDSLQDNVASLPNAVDGGYVTIVSPEGTSLLSVSAGDNPSPGDAPAGVEFPVGFFQFTVSGLTLGGSTTVTLLLPAGHTFGTYYQYGRTLDNPTPHWYEFLWDATTQTGAEILSDRIILHFVDGLRGDDDLTVNGQIVDPGAPAVRLIQPVTIDIYPNQTPNRVYLSKNYTISVVVFGSASFNVTSLNWSTVRFGRTGTEAAPVRAPTIRDMNADGFPDAMYGFLTFKCGFQLGDTEGILTGSTTSGIKIEGRDSVLVSP